MADKEATVFVIDVGRSMGRKHNGRSESDLDWSLHYIWDKITTTVATGRKSALIGVIGLRTSGTDNDLADDEGYQNITVLQPLKQTLMPDIRHLRELLQPSGTDDGDAVSAIVVAIQLIAAHCKKLKYTKRVILVTKGIGIIDAEHEELQQIAVKIKNDNIELTVLGVDFDDPDFGIKEETKDPTKELNERILHELAAACDGVSGTMAEAVAQLGIPRTKPVRPVSSYKKLLTLGDSAKYDSAMCIDVERYPKVMVAKPPTASKFIVRGDLAPGEASTQSSATLMNGQGGRMEVDDSLAAVKQARTYQVDDPDAPGGKRDVDMEDLAKGYEYGRTAVPISESDMNVVKLETHASLDIVGFVDARQYEQYMNMSKSNLIIANRANEKAKLALSSLIHALWELETYAVARFVVKDGKDPLLLLLAPLVEGSYECLVDVELPFAEDIRQYTFPPLDKVVTVAGKHLIQHRNLPSDELMEAMGRYVDAMDISKFGKDDDGNAAQYAPIEDTYSPVLHRINQVLRWRAVHPTDPIPEPYEILLRYSHPPDALVRQARTAFAAVTKAGDVKKVPPKQKGRKRTRDIEKPLSGLDVEGLLGREKRTKISADNAVPEFKQLLATAEDIETVKDATAQMAAIIEGYVQHGVGDSGYGRACEAIRVLKEELIEMDEERMFEDFLGQLKEKVMDGKLGGDRREFWWRVRAVL